ncbi:MAG: cytochrome c [Gammaproteobacteria bacterium]|nr:cytochrome c [Gammaproteobacteria bacterium]
MKYLIHALLASSSIICSLSVSANNDTTGKSIHNTNCVRCHDSSVYTRPQHKVTSLPSLEAQVRRCDSMLELQLFDEDINALVEFLNTDYYQFNK